MIKSRDFIVFSDEWDRHPSSTQHIVIKLLGENRVIWVNTIGLRSPTFTIYDIKRSFEKIFSWVKPKRESKKNYHKNLTVISPFMIPYNHINVVRKLNKYLVEKAIYKAVEKLGFIDNIVLTSITNVSDYAFDIKSSLVVYNCVDEYIEWPGVNKALVEEMENTLLLKSDLVVACSDELCNKKSINNREVFLLPHGVDIQHFSRRDKSLAQLPILLNLSGPVVGFFGAISEWIDYDLVHFLATSRPDWNFVFIGPIDSDISMLKPLKNVFFTGAVSYNDLPNEASVFDVGIIPFVVNELTESVNPLKLLEYFSCGFPVVSTEIPEVLKLSDVTYIAKDKNEFLEKLDISLSSDTDQAATMRLRAAESFSWDSIAEKLSVYIEDVESCN